MRTAAVIKKKDRGQPKRGGASFLVALKARKYSETPSFS